MRPAMGATSDERSRRGIEQDFNSCAPRWAQLQDLDTILLSILHLVFKCHFPIQSYLKITSILLYFGASLPVFLCMFITRTLHLIQ